MLRGAKKFLLTSRSGIKTNYQRYFFKQIDQLGKKIKSLKTEIKISTVNVIDEQNAKKLFDEAESMGKFGGIFQLAVVLHDELFENQTAETFNDVCKPKVDATINLDKLSRLLDYQLDYFVCFSSITCGRGNVGQSNYGYANSVMERICENRRKDGLHGLAIQWGPIGDVGVFVNKNHHDGMHVAGLLMQKLPSWLNALDKYLQCSYPVVSSLVRMNKRFKVISAEENVIKYIWQLIGVDPKTVPNYVTLEELGIGSIAVFEFQQRLQRDYDISLSMEEIRRITIGEMKRFEEGDREVMKQFAADLKIARANLSKIKFELSNEPLSKLNDVSNGKPIYLLPPFESIYDQFIPLAKLLPFPVYSLNWTHEMEQYKDIKEIALHYTNLMKTLEPNGDYMLLATNFGSFVALRMAYKKEPIKKLFLIDTLLVKKTGAYDDEIKKHELFEEQFSYIKRNISPSLFERLKNEGYNNKICKEKKIEGFIHNLKNLFPIQHSKDFEVIIKGTVKKAEMMSEIKEKYTKKFKENEENYIRQKITKNKMEKIKLNELIIMKSFTNNAEKEQLEENMLEIYENLLKSYGFNQEVS